MKKHTQLLRLTLAFSLACLPLAADAQQVEKLPRVGLLGSWATPGPNTRLHPARSSARRR
jgi:hypothetical protein